MRRGEVWWGEEPVAGRRPWLILTRDEAIGHLRNLVAVPITTTARRIPSEVELGPDDGLPQGCVASLDNIGPMPRALLIERIATLGPERMSQVCQALAKATSC